MSLNFFKLSNLFLLIELFHLRDMKKKIGFWKWFKGAGDLSLIFRPEKFSNHIFELAKKAQYYFLGPKPLGAIMAARPKNENRKLSMIAWIFHDQ